MSKVRWFSDILTHVTCIRVQPLDRIISFKFSLETWLESESFQPLINFLTFLVKLWFKINKIINYLNKRVIYYFCCF